MNAPKVTKYIVNWLKSYAENANIKGFVIGISGGIDSAVTSTLCAETNLEVLCLELPIHQGINQVNRAKEHIKQLKSKYPKVTSLEIDLTTTFDEIEKTLPKTKNKDAVSLALANTRARLRMTTLYYFAGLHGYLVAGTGNKVEDFGIGFFTKYGDGGVDISPIADLMKSEVYKIGEVLQVSKSIMEAKPTDGLFGDSRTDEDQIGASYDELEWAMLQIENGKSIDDFTGRKKRVMEIYTYRHRTNLHKMNPIPTCIIPKELFN